MGCYNSCVVNAPVEDVWARLRNFHDMSWAPNVITSIETEGDPGAGSGAKRLLNGAFAETLISVDDDARVMEYSIDDGPDPLGAAEGYVGTVRATPVTAGGGTFVEWSSRWASGPEGIAEFCNPVYQALLADLVKQYG